MSFKFSAFSFIFIFLFVSCSKDKTIPLNLTCDVESMIETKYSTNIKMIIDNSCANSGCHDGTNNDPIVKNYQTYEGILPELDNGEVWAQVFEDFDMPIRGSEGQENFSAEDVDLFRCWIENDFPK